MSLYIVIFLFGAVVGSFLNVCIYRIPRKTSIIFPSSRCPKCSAPIKAIYNIPIISYLILRGRCKECGERISFRYPFVEFFNGLLYMLVLWRFGIHGYTAIYLAFFSALLVITFIDLDFQIIPDIITLPGALIALVSGMLFLPDPFERNILLGIRQSLIGLVFGFGIFFSIAVLSEKIFKKEAMGGGDVKMMAMVGALTGWKGVLMTTFLGSLTGSIIGIALMIGKGRGRGMKIPFGPFLAFGAAISLVFGQEILTIYLHGQF